MTEAEWLVATDPMALLRHLGAEQAGRKYLLYLVAACRHITHLFHAPASVEAVGIAERYADGAADGKEMAGANGIAESPTFGFDFDADFYEQYPTHRTNLPRLVEMGALGESVLTGGEWRVNEPVCKRLAAAAELAYLTTLPPELNPGHLKRVELCISAVDLCWPKRWLVDCIFGNPFRPVTFSPSWRTDTALSLARQMYECRDFSAMPILADALQDAGCDSPEVLDHCRGDEPHVRGCWVVDLVLGKA